MYVTETVCRDYTRRMAKMVMIRLPRSGRKDARDDGRESVGRKAERHGRWDPRLWRGTHMVEVPLSIASTMSGCVE